MRFSTGMIGVTVVVVSLAVAILGSWALSTDVEDVEVTTYNYLTEITGLFDTTQAPEFVEYNPSTNYLGYYTEASTVGNERFFDGVDYTKSSNVNNYRVDLRPLDEQTGTLTAPSLTSTLNNPMIYMSWPTSTTAQDGSGYISYNNTATTVDLPTFIRALNLDPSINLVLLRSADNYTDYRSYQTTATLNVDLILFTTIQMWDRGANVDTLSVGTLDYVQDMSRFGVSGIQRPFLSASIDLRSQTVSLYYDNELSEAGGLYSFSSDTLITYGGTNTASGEAYVINFDDSIGYTYYALQPIYYMDPTRGVELS